MVKLVRCPAPPRDEPGLRLPGGSGRGDKGRSAASPGHDWHTALFARMTNRFLPIACRTQERNTACPLTALLALWTAGFALLQHITSCGASGFYRMFAYIRLWSSTCTSLDREKVRNDDVIGCSSSVVCTRWWGLGIFPFPPVMPAGHLT